MDLANHLLSLQAELYQTICQLREEVDRLKAELAAKDKPEGKK